MNILLFGFKGCGKTYFGKKLSAALHRPFIDVDDRIVALYQSKYHRVLSLREIYNALRESRFRALESEAIAQLTPEDNAVIALGGGSLLDPHNRAHLCRIGHLIYLKVSWETAKQRILAQGIPPFADPQNPLESLHQLYLQRTALFASLNTPSLDIDTLNEETVLQRLCQICHTMS